MHHIGGIQVNCQQKKDVPYKYTCEKNVRIEGGATPSFDGAALPLLPAPGYFEL